VSFSGHPDFVHNVSRYADLYNALRVSASFYTFIDTDERLYFAHDGRLYADYQHLAEIVSPLNDGEFYAGYWAHGVPLLDNMIDFGLNSFDCKKLFLDGKPVLSKNFLPRGYVNHNFQLIQNNPDSVPIGGFITAHFPHLNLQRRFEVNIAKIVALGFASCADEVHLSLANIDHYAKNVQHRRYLEDIRDILSGSFPERKWGEIDISDEKNLIFSDDSVRAIFSMFSADFSAFSRFDW
jgi:hypothetical protein